MEVSLDYVNLGIAGVKVSRLALGMMTYGTPKWRPWVLDEDASRPFIKRALELGINFFDTADMYSLGESEAVLGRALKDFGIARDKVVIATKVHFPMGDDPNQRGLSRKHIMHAIDDSLRREASLVGVVADRKSTRLNSSHVAISYAVFCVEKREESRDCRVCLTRRG